LRNHSTAQRIHSEPDNLNAARDLVDAIMTDDGCPSPERDMNMRIVTQPLKPTAASRAITAADVPGTR
jgi:hypothetical protein